MNKLRQYLIIFTFLVLGMGFLVISCEKDPQVACNCFQGKICTEYWYNSKECLGYFEYKYNSDGLLSEKVTYSSKSGTNNSEKYQYDDQGRIKSISFRVPKNGIYSSYLYFYDQKGNCINEQWLTNSQVIRNIEYTYNPTNLPERVIHKTHDSIDSIEVFQYYNTRKLYLRQKRNSNDSLLTYTRYEYFSNSINKETCFNSRDSVLFWRKIYLDSLNRPVEIKYTSLYNEYLEQRIVYRNQYTTKLESFDRNGNMILRKEFVWGE